jgi:hypothetical protein
LSQERLARVASVVVGVSSFAAYALCCAPSAYLLDSAELAQAAFGLGVAHPPGEPVAALWGKVFCLLPVGSAAFKAGLSQAAAGAVAAVLLLRIALRLIATVDPGRALAPLPQVALAAAAALGFAFAPGALIVADRPEVYALQTALSLGAVLCALRALAEEDARFLLLAALLLGLGIANHPLVAGLTGVGATLAALPYLRRGPARLVLLSVLVFVAGAAAIAYLPARAGALFAQAAERGADTIAWGDARTPAGLGWVLSARTFASKAAIVHGEARPFDFPFVLMDELEVVFAMLAPVGIFLLLRRPGRLPGLVAAASWAGAIAAALYAGFDPANPDVRGYLGPAIGLTAAFSVTALAAGLVPIAQRWSGARIAPVPALAVAMLLATFTRFPAGGDYPGLRHAATADRLTGQLLGELPARAALLSAHFESAFLIGYQRLVEGRRPDVAWAHLGFVAHPGALARLTAAEPELGPALQARQSPPALFALDRRRPLRLEPDEHLSRGVRARMVPDGLVWKLAGEPGPPAAAPAKAMLEEAAADRQVRGFLAWRAYTDAVLACENHLPEAARRGLALLQRLLPEDERARRLAAECAALSNNPAYLRGAP